jgi:prolyl oligopeptidase
MQREVSMRSAISAGLLCALAAAPALGAQPGTAAATALDYPQARKVEVVDDYHGARVADPYRWMEDLDAPAVKEWVEAENKVTFGYLATLPRRQALRQRLTELWDYERFGVPEREGGRYFFKRNDGLQNQDVLYTVETLTGEPRVLLDPNLLSPDGTIALSTYAVSEDGKQLAYALAAAGSDWIEWKVRDVASGRDLVDHIKWSKFSDGSWTKDHKGFFYSRYDEPKAGQELEDVNYFQKVYYHAVGTTQDQDLLVYERKDHKDWGFDAEVTEDGRYLAIAVWQGTDPKNAFFYKDLTAGGPAGGKVVELLSAFDATYSYLGNDGPLFWFFTNLDAPRGRVVAIDVRNPARAKWQELVPESQDTLEGVSLVGDRFVLNYLRDASSRVVLAGLDGKPLGEVPLPGLGTAAGFTGERGDTETFYSFTSFTTPLTVYRLDLETGRSEIFRQPKVAFDPAGYETEQVFLTSKDGTRVPMFISRKKGLAPGPKPTLLYGYGGFNSSLTPKFSVSKLVWMEMGGLYASVNLRGGNEYGEDWHLAGTKLRKQNVFDDFIAAAEHLIAKGHSSRDRLAIQGGSNGGLLVGAAMNQRPELFAAALPAVGVMDMLRFHKFTIGWAWTSDYGSSDDPAEFKAIHAYSPLHNLKAGTCYPATLITTADHDDRVVPSHSFKYAAKLQEAQGCARPVLIRIETKAGHGAGKPTDKQIEEAADVLAFAAANTAGGERPGVTVTLKPEGG